MANLSAGQFSLRSVLILITAAAGLSALGTWLGARTAILFLGLFLALANYLGMLAFVQRPRFAQVALYVAFAAFAASFFLPAYALGSLAPGALTTSYTPPYLAGWQAWLAPFWDMHRAWVDLLRHSSHLSRNVLATVALAPALLIVTADNLAMLCAPALAHHVVTGMMKWYRGLLVITAAGSWLVPMVCDHPRLQIGYFVWCAALSVPVVALRITKWNLIALALIAGWFGGGLLFREWLMWGFH